jgi:hypothetical protein
MLHQFMAAVVEVVLEVLVEMEVEVRVEMVEMDFLVL